MWRASVEYEQCAAHHMCDAKRLVRGLPAHKSKCALVDCKQCHGRRWTPLVMVAYILVKGCDWELHLGCVLGVTSRLCLRCGDDLLDRTQLFMPSPCRAGRSRSARWAAKSSHCPSHSG
jgi:hypothetical protein